MVAYIRKMAVDDKQWLDKETFKDGVALCQIIPGATAMQSAAYVGLKTRGVSGAAATFVGFGLPAFLLMSLLALVYQSVIHHPISIFVFSCLQAMIVAIIANATVSFGKATLKEWKSVLITVFAIVLFGLKWNPILIIVLSAALGILLGMRKKTSQPQTAKISSSTDGPACQEKAESNLRDIAAILLAYAVLLVVLFFWNRRLFVFSTLMFRIDLFAYGGGFASVPLMFHEIVDVRHLLSSQTFLNGIALGQVTPGPIVITATFIGYMLSGIVGGIIGTISIFLPSFLMVIGITPIFDRLRSKKLFDDIIRGVFSSFVGLLFTVTIQFALNVHWGLAQMVIGAGALVALLLKRDILYVVLIGTAVSVVIFVAL